MLNFADSIIAPGNTVEAMFADGYEDSVLVLPLDAEANPEINADNPVSGWWDSDTQTVGASGYVIFDLAPLPHHARHQRERCSHLGPGRPGPWRGGRLYAHPRRPRRHAHLATWSEHPQMRTVLVGPYRHLRMPPHH